MSGPGEVLTIDVGGTAIKFGVGGNDDLGGSVPTVRPCSPTSLLEQLDDIVAAAVCDEIVIGLAGSVVDGRVESAYQFWREDGREVAALRAAWEDFDLASFGSARWRIPVTVVNDAVLHGASIVGGSGVELVLTLGTGVGSSLWVDGAPIAIDLAFHPFADGESYTEQLCDAALRRVGDDEWRRRVSVAVHVLRRVFRPDTLFLGGGNARLLDEPALGPGTRVVANSVAIAGGAAIAERLSDRGDRGGSLVGDLRLHGEEPRARGWHVEQVGELVDRIVRTWPSGRPAIVAIDGRSANGKSTLAARVARALPGTAVVHTDDIAWHYSMFDWDTLLAEGVLEPARRGRGVEYGPPAWDERERPGAVVVPSDARLVVVEGVGSARRSLAPFLDAVLWVQSDLDRSLARDRHRMAAGETSPNLFVGWMRDERPFQAAERTWDRADAIVAGTPVIELDDAEVLVGRL